MNVLSDEKKFYGAKELFKLILKKNLIFATTKNV